jgi:phosphatidylglycerophosphate synthase
VDRATEPPPQGGPAPAAGGDDEASRGFDRIQRRYIDGVRRAAANSVGRLARTGITPNMLTVAGVSISALGAIAVYFEYRDELLAFWVGAALFIAGAVLDILDGALARTTGRAGPYGAFVDSTTDRLGEAFMLGAIALVLMREGNEIAVAAAFAALTGSLLVSYTRARGGARPARQRRHRQPRRTRGRHLRRTDPRSVALAPVGDLPAHSHFLDHRAAARAQRPLAAQGARRPLIALLC